MINEQIKLIIKNTLTVILLNAVNFSSSFVIAIIITRLLGAESLGQYTYILAISSVIYLISDFGLTTLLIRKISEDEQATFYLIKQFNKIKLLFSTVCVTIIILSFSFSKYLMMLLPAVLAVYPRLLQATYE